jgi:hypothetical protein
MAQLGRFSNRGKVSRWIALNYWKGGWRSWLAGLLVRVSNRFPGLLP